MRESLIHWERHLIMHEVIEIFGRKPPGEFQSSRVCVCSQLVKSPPCCESKSSVNCLLCGGLKSRIVAQPGCSKHAIRERKKSHKCCRSHSVRVAKRTSHVHVGKKPAWEVRTCSGRRSLRTRLLWESHNTSSRFFKYNTPAGLPQPFSSMQQKKKRCILKTDGWCCEKKKKQQWLPSESSLWNHLRLFVKLRNLWKFKLAI